MSRTIYMTKGLPGSGKTTWALAEVSSRPNGSITRINKDDLRAMMHGGRHSKTNERLVLAARDNIVLTALEAGMHVISDDTNLNPLHEERLRYLAETLGVDFVVKSFTDVPLSLCLERNRLRQDKDPVPERVIRNMYSKWIVPTIVRPSYDETLPHCLIVDLDGTLAHMDGRRGPYDWDKVSSDRVDGPVIDFIGSILREGNHQVIILSGRDGSAEADTRDWLNAFLDPSDYLLYMRQAGDIRKDAIVKRELFEAHVLGKYYPWLVLDDRDQVVRMWRDELGLTVWQVADGDF
jgi:predicted kinase